jgi:hypothetical protein
VAKNSVFIHEHPIDRSAQGVNGAAGLFLFLEQSTKRLQESDENGATGFGSISHLALSFLPGVFYKQRFLI